MDVSDMQVPDEDDRHADADLEQTEAKSPGYMLQISIRRA